MGFSLTLIDKAKDICGSYYKLSKQIDLAESTISEIRKGTRRLPPDCVPLLADMCNIDVHEAIEKVMLEYAVGTKREAALRAVLGKGIAAGVAAMLVFSYSGDSIGSTVKTAEKTEFVNMLYIVLSRLYRKVRGFLDQIAQAPRARVNYGQAGA